ncbi:threonine-phosphate decarboxylase CobD [Magnetospirillum sp. UT-4]|uniref:threonine-phosphate decarboxylase CobD n=1 Tax=Magnetospirillum sp. UT-4 TaxID=2681467 RepID=UPI00137D372A|nr:threonine-phosphate decarboxylase CobD [Magnetospirillum sp. UT-4]CAA7618370.1 Threonine-phosphate decarboxylase [Magnetospirillum sp. UT-4]
MALDPLPVHGGDLAAAEARWGRPHAGWLDLSTGINPWPYPLPALSPEAWTRLPGAAAEAGLRDAAARHYGCDPGQVLAAPGTGALIRALPRCLPAGTVAVVGPTYGEHAPAWTAAGHAVREVTGLEQAEGADVALVVNPNNPDGRRVAPAMLTARAGFTLVDEAFGEVAPELSVAGRVGPRLAVLRSFGKFYGLAGLRLGFLIADPAVIAAVAAQLGPWPVSGPALAVGTKALSDQSWADSMRPRLEARAAALDGVLAAAGLRVVGGTGLFRLAAHDHAAALYDCLGRAGILVRAFPARPTLLRFGLPGDEGGLERLAGALTPPPP